MGARGAINKMIRAAFFVICIASVTTAFAADYVGGQTDITTPQVRLIEPEGEIRVDEPFTVVIRFSDDFDYCDECVAPLPDGYGQYPQIPQQGHAHTYLQRVPEDGGFEENNGPDGISSSFCALTPNNPTLDVGPGFVRGECPSVTKSGRYRLCVVLQTNAHVLRVMARPVHFPSIDCKIIDVTE